MSSAFPAGPFYALVFDSTDPAEVFRPAQYLPSWTLSHALLHAATRQHDRAKSGRSSRNALCEIWLGPGLPLGERFDRSAFIRYQLQPFFEAERSMTLLPRLSYVDQHRYVQWTVDDLDEWLSNGSSLDSDGRDAVLKAIHQLVILSDVLPGPHARAYGA